MRKKKTHPDGKVVFYNNKGDRLNVPITHTIEDLLEMGVTEIKLCRKGSFLPEGWYSNEKPKKRIIKSYGKRNQKNVAVGP